MAADIAQGMTSPATPILVRYMSMEAQMYACNFRWRQSGMRVIFEGHGVLATRRVLQLSLSMIPNLPLSLNVR